MNSLTIASCLHLAPQLAPVSDSARLDIELLLCHILGKSRTWLFTWPEKTLSAAEATLFETYFARRLKGEPIAHIIGEREFWSLPLLTNNTTLIPRPDTEILIEVALQCFKSDAENTLRRVLDLGAGTGAIVLALASEKKYWQLLGVDHAADAVALAEKNRARLGFEQVHIKSSNWFAQINAQEKFDLIVSNPPYIDPQDPHLLQGDVRFEPLSALIADNHGLADLEFIIQTSPNYLAANGWLLLEHGYDQAEKVRELMVRRGFVQVSTQRDYGDNERVTSGQFQQ